jgi:MFS family permease
MLSLFCMAEFMDAFIASALFPAVNQMNEALHLGTNESTWIFAAFAATFSAFLLISGRVADIYGSSM